VGEQQASGYSVQVQGLDTCLRVLTKAGSQLHDLDTSRVRLANSQLRFEAKQVADRFGKEVLAPLVSAHGGPIGNKMADTIRPKADRLPIARIGAVNPKLSGFNTRGKPSPRRNIAPSRWKGSLAWGLEFGPHPRSKGNRYGRGRRSGGYVIGPRMDVLQSKLAPLYVPLLVTAMETAGWPVNDRGSV
jgi:hypothetical protein